MISRWDIRRRASRKVTLRETPIEASVLSAKIAVD